MRVGCVVMDRVLGMVLVVVISIILSVSLAFFIDTNHIRFMMGNCPAGCPSAFPTPLFYITLALTLPLMIVAGIIILNALKSSSRVITSQPNLSGDQFMQGDLRSIENLLPRLEREVLSYIANHGGEVSQASISKDLGLGKVRTWRIIKRLESKGLVEVYKIKGRNIVRIKRKS